MVNAVTAANNEISGLASDFFQKTVPRRRPGKAYARLDIVVVAAISVIEAILNFVRRSHSLPTKSQVQSETWFEAVLIFKVKVGFLEAIVGTGQAVALVVAGQDAIEEIFPSSKTGAIQRLGRSVDAAECPEAALRAAGYIIERLESLINAHAQRMAIEHDGVVVNKLVV